MMDFTEFWPVILLLSYFVLYGLLWLSASMCHVPELSAGKLAVAALVLLIALGALNYWAGSLASGLSSLSSGAELIVIPIWLGANLLLTLLVVPWILRPPPEYGSRSAWGAAALCGVFACILLIGVPYTVAQVSSEARHASVRNEGAQLLQRYDLPVPAGADFGVSSIEPHALAPPPYMGPRGQKPPPRPWYNQHSATHAVLFTLKQPPASVYDAICAGLAQSGYEVHRLPHQMIGAIKPGVFVRYEITPDQASVQEAAEYGVQLNRADCWVRIYENHAEELAQACRKAAGGS